MNEKELERRFELVGDSEDLEVVERRAADGKGDPVKVIRGYAAVFGKRSVDLGGFVETIDPAAFTRAVQEGQDVRALWNHNSDKVLGRTKSGTLSLEVDQKGLRFELEPADTQAGRDALVSIARKDVSSMSFGFRTQADRWDRQDPVTKLPKRTLLDVDLVDVSPVAYPAYPQTSAVVAKRAQDHAAELRGHQAPEAPPQAPEGIPDTETYRRRLALESWDDPA